MVDVGDAGGGVSRWVVGGVAAVVGGAAGGVGDAVDDLVHIRDAGGGIAGWVVGTGGARARSGGSISRGCGAENGDVSGDVGFHRVAIVAVVVVVVVALIALSGCSASA